MWRLDDDRALVATVDVITPVVDDARTWGRIAATNAVSDVYAMGGRPLFALNIVAWNNDELDAEQLGEVLEGGAEAAAAGGWIAVGGHSITDPHPKFGLAVIGEVHPDRVLRNSGLRPGDWLVLTKPLGIGAITTGIKQGSASADSVDAAVASMLRSNAQACDAALAAGAAGATDVTGFGLLGHLGSMVRASGVDATVTAADVPLLPGAHALAAAGVLPGATDRNRQWITENVLAADESGDDAAFALLCDPQTSGGLLFGVAERARADDAVAQLRDGGHDAAVIGHTAAGEGRVRVV